MVATPIPTIGFNSITNPSNLMQGAANAVPDGILGLAILALIMGIVFRSVESYPFNQRLLASLSTGFLISILLLMVGLVGINYVMVLAVLTFIAWIMTG